MARAGRSETLLMLLTLLKTCLPPRALPASPLIDMRGQWYQPLLSGSSPCLQGLLAPGRWKGSDPGRRASSTSSWLTPAESVLFIMPRLGNRNNGGRAVGREHNSWLRNLWVIQPSYMQNDHAHAQLQGFYASRAHAALPQLQVANGCARCLRPHCMSPCRQLPG